MWGKGFDSRSDIVEGEIDVAPDTLRVRRGREGCGGK